MTETAPTGGPEPGSRGGYRVFFAQDGRLDPPMLAAVARLLAETAQRGEAVGLPSTITEAEYAGQLRDLLGQVARGDAGLVVAAAPNGEVVASAQWTRSGYRTQHVLGVVDRVAVLPERRGGGIGGEVVAAICGHAREHGIEVLELTVRGNNHAAIALYERLGFRRSGLLPGVVALGPVRHDVVIMCREFERPAGLDLLGSLPAGGGASLPRAVTGGPGWQRTERLLLCLPDPATDADAYFAINADPAANRHNPQPLIADPAAGRKPLLDWSRHWAEYGYGYWTVRDPADGSVLGFGGIMPPFELNPHLNLYYRFRPSAWGRGYATEMGRAALALAAKEAPGIPVAAMIRPSNEPSIRVAERLGLRHDQDVQRESGLFARYLIVP
ncbi:MAG TPA: GNAT family N-acetyltransferase [Actinocrinis sp.]|jgi:RimJ/RimL family protein N-acetyltransferase